jgi:hypothetical protein
MTTLETLVFTAIGQVSVCWNPRPDGVFDSTAAEEIGTELCQKIRALPTSTPKPLEVADAVKVLANALKSDESFRQTWKANIAVSFEDEYHHAKENRMISFHVLANKGADRFIDLLCKY